MTREEFLKYAYARGYDQAMLEKDAGVIDAARRVGRGVKRVFTGRGDGWSSIGREAGGSAAAKAAPSGTAGLKVAPAEMTVPRIQARRAVRRGPEASQEWWAKASPEARKRYTDYINEIRQHGARAWESPVAWAAAPAALGAGVGAVADGREGALTGALAGAGLGLGARMGAGGLLQRLREVRGLGAIRQAAGKPEAAARALTKRQTGRVMESPVARRAMLMGGGLGAAGAAGGGLLGSRLAPEETAWYQQPFLGLSQAPGRWGEATRTFLPLLMQTAMANNQAAPAMGMTPMVDPYAAPQMPTEMGHY